MALLACDERAGTFLEVPAAQLVARELAEDSEGEVKKVETPTPPPSAVGRYRIERELGRGGMGSVYAGYDPELGRRVAIKLIRTDLLSSEEQADYLQRFQHEARAAGRCAHPNIVAIYDFAVELPGHFFGADNNGSCVIAHPPQRTYKRP